MSNDEQNLLKGKFIEEKRKEALSLYSINQKKEEILDPLTNEIKKKSKTQEKNDEKNKINKEEVGYKIGKYLIKKTIGRGSFGKVKLGIYLPNKEKVAIKILDKKRITEKDDLIRIKREFEMLSKFDHPNIILIAEIFETKERYYSVMEYCENGELFNYIVKNRYLSEEEASFFFYQLICGLEYIHSLGIVHRDLKPENLLLTKNNLLKIIDFGLSHYHDANPDCLLETPCGSPCYASPEMVSGFRYDGYKIDIWSSGVILFAMLCGYLPFEHKNNKILFQKILECKVKLPNHLSEDSKDLILKILVKDPNKRISIEQIKNHPFYLKGKNIFTSNFEIEQINFKNNKINIEKYEKYEKSEKSEKTQKENIQLKDKTKEKIISKRNTNEKILIIENNNQNNDDENNKKPNNTNNMNIMTYQPILTDYDNFESKLKGKKNIKKLNRNLNSKKSSKNNNKRVSSSGVKTIKNRSSNNTKENFNIIELLKLNIFNQTYKNNKKLQNKKSHKVISNTSKNFSSGNLTKKLNSFLYYNKNTYKSNGYEIAVIHTDTNSKKKESSKNYLNKRINSNIKKQTKIKDSDNGSYKSRLITDTGINSLNNMNRQINNFAKFNKKGINYIRVLRKNSNIIKNTNKGNLINNLFDKYIHRIIDKKQINSNNINKKSKANSKSKQKVIKLMKQSDNIKEEKKKLNHFNYETSNIGNTGLIDSEFSSYILKTEPNQYGKVPNNNLLLNEIMKNINTNPERKKKKNTINNKRKNNLQIVKQKSIPTLSDFSDYIYKTNNNKNFLTTKNKKRNLINNNYINKQRINLYNISKKSKAKKSTQNNSLTKKNSFFTIRNTMINLNIHTPAVIISSYHKKGLDTKKNKKIKYSDIESHDTDSISSNKNKNIPKEIKGKNRPFFNSVKTRFDLITKKNKNKNKIEFEQFNMNKQNTINKKNDLKNKFNYMKIGNIIKDNNNKYNYHQDKKNIVKRQSNNIIGKLDNKKQNTKYSNYINKNNKNKVQK